MHGSKAQYSLKGIPLYLSDRAVRIGDKDDFERLTQEIEAIKAIEGDIGMIVVDTFQRILVVVMRIQQKM